MIQRDIGQGCGSSRKVFLHESPWPGDVCFIDCRHVLESWSGVLDLRTGVNTWGIALERKLGE